MKIGLFVNVMGAATFGLLALVCLYGAIVKGAYIHYLTAALCLWFVVNIVTEKEDSNSIGYYLNKKLSKRK